MTKGVVVQRLRAKFRGSQIATFDAVIGGYLVLHDLELHRHEAGYCFVKWSRSISWQTPRIASRFRIATLTAIGHSHPQLFKTGLTHAPLLDAPPDNSTGGAMQKK
jgi:hypothetical protein